MKRMYLALTILFGVVFWAGTLLGQQRTRPADDNENDHYAKRLQLRAEMHRRMMDKILRGIGPDSADMFSDMEKMMDEVMADSFSGFSSLQATSENFSMAWLESAQGRTLAITPKTPEQQLDINVAHGMVVIKGQTEQKTRQGSFSSNFTNSFSVPDDCDASRVRMDQKEGKILVHFPYLKARPAQLNSEPAPKLKPLPPSQGDVEI